MVISSEIPPWLQHMAYSHARPSTSIEGHPVAKHIWYISQIIAQAIRYSQVWIDTRDASIGDSGG